MWGARQRRREKMKRRKRSKVKEEELYVFHLLCDVRYLVFHSMLCIYLSFWVWSVNVSRYDHLCVHIRTESWDLVSQFVCSQVTT